MRSSICYVLSSKQRCWYHRERAGHCLRRVTIIALAALITGLVVLVRCEHSSQSVTFITAGVQSSKLVKPTESPSFGWFKWSGWSAFGEIFRNPDELKSKAKNFVATTAQTTTTTTSTSASTSATMTIEKPAIGPDQEAFIRELQSSYSNYMKHLPRRDFLVGRSASIKCDLHPILEPGFEDEDYDVSFRRINRSTQAAEFIDHSVMISCNDQITITDKRFKIVKHSSLLWELSIDMLRDSDGPALYMCHVFSRVPNESCAFSPFPLYGFSRGLILRVQSEPKIVEEETSPHRLVVDEYEPLTLRCKAYSFHMNQMTWRRGSLNGSDQSVNGAISWERATGPSPAYRQSIVWFDSVYLEFKQFIREYEGPYWCVARNEVGAAVAHLVEVVVINCRRLATNLAPLEDCSAPRAKLKLRRISTSSIPKITPVSPIGSSGERLLRTLNATDLQETPTTENSTTAPNAEHLRDYEFVLSVRDGVVSFRLHLQSVQLTSFTILGQVCLLHTIWRCV